MTLGLSLPINYNIIICVAIAVSKIAETSTEEDLMQIDGKKESFMDITEENELE